MQPCLRAVTVLVAAFVFLAMSSPPAEAQPEFSGIPAPGTPTYDLDFAAFRSGADSVRLEIYYRIVNPRLSYIRRTEPLGKSQPDAADLPAGKGDSTVREYYVAAYEMTAILSDNHDPQAATVTHRENYRLESFEETRSATGYIINVLSVTVAPRNYKLAVTLNDRVAGSSYLVKREIKLHQFRDADWLFGGPEFIDPEATAPGQPHFRKPGGALVPNVKRSFSGVSDRLALYLELYPTPERRPTRLIVDAYQRTGRHAFVDTVALKQKGDLIPLVYRSELPGLGTGETRLRFTPLAANGDEAGVMLETYFWIDWTVAGMVHQNWEETVDMLVHIADQKEMKALRETPENERENAFNAFWKSHDPNAETSENEWKQEYYRRIRYADLHFTTAFMRGWRTDFGTVYIRYGEPDEVERYPFERDRKPYQIWYYYGQSRQFVFVDTRGNGDYELQYPYDGWIR